jgi:hypothetical protein
MESRASDHRSPDLNRAAIETEFHSQELKADTLDVDSIIVTDLSRAEQGQQPASTTPATCAKVLPNSNAQTVLLQDAETRALEF